MLAEGANSTRMAKAPAAKKKAAMVGSLLPAQGTSAMGSIRRCSQWLTGESRRHSQKFSRITISALVVVTVGSMKRVHAFVPEVKASLTSTELQATSTLLTFW